MVTGLTLGWTRGGQVTGQVPAWLSKFSSPTGSLLGIGVPPVLVVWGAITIVCTVVLHLTVTGRRVFATGANVRAARLAGVATGRMWIGAFVVSALAAALVGILLTGYIGTGQAGVGDQYLFGSLAAVIVGGTSLVGARGDYLRTVIGALILTLINILLVGHGARQPTQEILIGVLILVFVGVYGRDRRVRDRVSEDDGTARKGIIYTDATRRHPSSKGIVLIAQTGVRESQAASGEGSPSVSQRILMTLEACAAHKRSLTLAELVDETGLAKTTLHRTCWKLVELGLLEHSDAGFSVGVKMFALGNSNPVINDLRVAAMPLLLELQRETGGMSNLAILHEGKALVIDALYTVQPSIPRLVGASLPLHCTAVGKAIAANLEADEREELVANRGGLLPAATWRTIVRPALLRANLDQVAEDGWPLRTRSLWTGCAVLPPR